MTTTRNSKLLHIYTQDSEHEEVKIVGTRQSLEALQKAINKLISSSNSSATEKVSDFICKDRKEYEVSVLLKPESSFQEEELPYSLVDVWDGESV